MNFLFVTVLLTALMVLVVLRRKKKNASRSGRYRSPIGRGLMLDRFGSRRRKTLRTFSLQPRHILLGVVLSGMFFWLVSGYFLSDETPSAVVYESKAVAALPEQYASLGGQIFAGSTANSLEPARRSPAVAGVVSAQAPAAPARALAIAPTEISQLQLAAHSALPTDSSLGQVGLIASRANEKATAAAPKAAANKPKVPAAAQSKAKAAAQEPNASPSAGAAAKAANSTSAAAAKSASAPIAFQPESKPRLATNKQASSKSLLGESRRYTVHLGSFSEKNNAENYLAQLLSAGEEAFISESVIDGRLWHRVMSGQFENRDDAESYGRNLKKRGLTVETGRYLVKSIDKSSS